MPTAVLAAICRLVWLRGAAGAAACTALALLLLIAAAPGQAQETVAKPPAKDVVVFPTLRPGQQRMVSDHYPQPVVREAIVYVRFDVTKSGSTANIDIGEGGFYDERFANAAKTIAGKLRFSPATRNGVPEEAKGLTMPIRFNILGSRGITKEFRNEIRKIVTFIKDKDYAGAHHHAQWMLAEKVTLNFENALLQATLAETHARMGNFHRALAASRQATNPSGMSVERYAPGGPIPKRSDRDYVLTIPALAPILHLRYRLAASQGFVLEALRTHADMQALGLDLDEDATLANFLQLLDQALTTSELVANVRIDEDGGWLHELLFRTFTLADVEGRIDAITLMCQGQTRNIQYKPDIEFNVPAKWNACSLYISGSPGTAFKIVEFRDTAEK